MNNRPEQYKYVMAHRDDVVNINDRSYLESVEASLKNEHTEGDEDESRSS
jgi:hypothetical protein